MDKKLNHTRTTEQVILQAAEAEFLEKGYANAKMLSIAQRAGVAHSMLHYYYRSKENLFQVIFRQKMQAMLPAYDELSKEELPFEDILRKLRDARDRLLWPQSPKMPYFVLTEVLANPQNRGMLLHMIEDTIMQHLPFLKERLENEIAEGNIRPISMADFFMLLIAIDASSLSAINICRDIPGLGSETAARLQTTCREHNMQLILDALRP